MLLVMPRDLAIRLPDGRALEVSIDGADSGLPVLFHHGTPSAGLLFPPLVAAAAKRGLMIVAYSRAGYAGSTARPGRSVADVVPVIGAIMDEIGHDRFLTMGWSGGGPHALACAAMLPGRCLAAASIAGIAPYNGLGDQWLAGMGQENIDEFGLAMQGEEQLSAWLEKEGPPLRQVTPSDVAAALGGLVSETDRAAVTDEFAEFLARCFRKGVSSGFAGWRDDDLAFVREWGFDLAEIAVPVAIWQGEQDRMVPFSHGQWLAEHVPGARSRLHRDQGHLSLMAYMIDAIVEDLVAMAGSPATN
jgi:pimeloyl-ACP methyl ester carboxylesterase